MAVDLYLAVPLLFTVLALVLTSIFMRLRGAEGEQPQQPVVVEAAGESGPGDQTAAGLGPEVGKEAAAEQWEEVAEEPSPAGEPSPAVAKSIPWQPPAEPGEPEPQEDVESKIPPLGASAGSSLRHPEQVEDAGDHAAFPSKAEEEELDSGKEKLVMGEPASTAATPAPVTSTAASFESSEGFEWPLGTLGTCLLIVMGISMLAHIQSVFYS
ncbi:eukaryotic translation initiation factor 3 subunit B-like [Pezoporus wallicus]|uniref:eukaryotic translation initiation factor 3 subunit B-like n=1 Tax=Pezoporus wallicus TaxID=35540 RepID=UPI00254DDF4F|nr:eukaryotic translation initiation factor 3 subunit B-like [Pezoporus wallicus]